MHPKNQKRFYSPRFSELAAVSVRRLAWSLERSMPAAMDHIIKLLPSVVDSSKVCLSCLDSTKCSCCIFGSLGNKQEAVALAAGQQHYDRSLSSLCKFFFHQKQAFFSWYINKQHSKGLYYLTYFSLPKHLFNNFPHISNSIRSKNLHCLSPQGLSAQSHTAASIGWQTTRLISGGFK